MRGREGTQEMDEREKHSVMLLLMKIQAADVEVLFPAFFFFSIIN